jgi:hypothetical protein
MLLAEHADLSLVGTSVFRFGVLKPTHLLQYVCQVMAAHQGVGMVVPQDLPTSVKHCPEFRFGLYMSALSAKNGSQGATRVQAVRMVIAQLLCLTVEHNTKLCFRLIPMA